ncbi:MAG: hypothetical protein K2X27_13905 [Candidatus Obscuribacterales bacterium]|nr:hypothetical protein [Candidatus Obscuribacterales bacterium]
MKIAGLLSASILLLMQSTAVLASAESNSCEAGSKQDDWLIPEILAIPTNVSLIEEKQIANYEPRKIAASLLERKRQFDERWSKNEDLEQNKNEKNIPDYEIVSFFPEEFIESLIKNGQLNGHELAQKVERQSDADACILQDMQIKDEKKRLERLLEDGRYMQGRGQMQAAIKIYGKALTLAETSAPERCAEIKEKIDLFSKQSKDPSLAATRAYGWSRRAQLEFLHLGITIGSSYKGGCRNLANSILPKYGIINFKSPVSVSVNRRELLHYGAVLIVYRDELKFRTSYSYGDSTVLSKDEASGLVKGPEVHSLMILDTAKAPVNKAIFVESQSWGPIDLSDIKEFRVPEGRDDLAKALSKSGLPIYSYRRSELGAEPTFVSAENLGISSEKLLYKGDEKLQAKYSALRAARLKQ